MYILHLEHITVQMNRFSSAEHRCTVATALDSRNIGRVYHSRNFSWTVLLQGVLRAWQSTVLIVQDARDRLFCIHTHLLLHCY